MFAHALAEEDTRAEETRHKNEETRSKNEETRNKNDGACNKEEGGGSGVAHGEAAQVLY